jgi:sigma-E factor negative regulatory protein RseC
MMEQDATVLAAEGDFAQVQIARTLACGGCAEQVACGTAAVGKWLSRRRLEVRVHNPIGALPGDRVVIGISEGALTQASVAAYLLPVLGLLVGAGTAQALLGSAAGEAAAIVGGAAGLAAGLAWLAGFAKRRRKDSAFRAVVLRRVKGLPDPVQVSSTRVL